MILYYNFYHLISDTSVCINMEIICEMAYQLIQGTNISDNSVPDVVKQKFKQILDEMHVLLRQFGIAIQDIDVSFGTF